MSELFGDWIPSRTQLIAKDAPPRLPKRKEGSAAALLLEAARTLPQPFSLTALVLMAWEHWPEVFGLAGCREHPSDNKVRTVVYGVRGLLKSGHLVGVGDMKFRVA